MDYFAHKTAIIDENVKIGKNCKIWHFSHILSGSVIGENCSFGQNCVIGPIFKWVKIVKCKIMLAFMKV